jgi:hypothetical protein
MMMETVSYAVKLAMSELMEKNIYILVSTRGLVSSAFYSCGKDTEYTYTSKITAINLFFG